MWSTKWRQTMVFTCASNWKGRGRASCTMQNPAIIAFGGIWPCQAPCNPEHCARGTLSLTVKARHATHPHKLTSSTPLTPRDSEQIHPAHCWRLHGRPMPDCSPQRHIGQKIHRPQERGHRHCRQKERCQQGHLPAQLVGGVARRKGPADVP